MKVGVVGVGSMGQNHARIYSGMKGVDLVGVVDSDAARGKWVAETYKTKALSDYRDLLREGIDAVSVVVPTSLHFEVASFFLKNGVDCLVEKPITPSLEEGKALVDLAKEHGKKLMVGHIERFNPAVQKAKQIIQEGLLGKVLIISTRRVGPYSPRITDVGIIIDLATHDIDVARYLTGKEPNDIWSAYGSIKHTKEDHALLLLDFGGCAACVEVNWFTPHKVRTAVITGTGGIAYMDYIEQALTVYNSEWKMEPKIEKEEPLKNELKHFVECVTTGKEPLVNGEEGLKTLGVALKSLQKMPK
jgi:UDP-N-acetylglucosamine 3-dehydrogenase